MDESDLFDLIASHYSPPAWACLRSVRNGTGFRRNLRTADALAMSLYPSRGLEIHGFEIKSSRGDWRRELKNPNKAEDIASYCDRWWIVAPTGVVERDELPPAWGLMEPCNNKLKVIKSATVTEAKEIDRLFLAAILRRAQESMTENTVPISKIEERLEQSRMVGVAEGKLDGASAKQELQRLQNMVKAFEDASGISIARSFPGLSQKLGKVVSQVMSANSIKEAEAQALSDLYMARRRLNGVSTSIERLIQEVEQDEGKKPRAKKGATAP